MKKHGMLKILGSLLLLVMIVSFILAGRSGTVDYVGIGDVLLNASKSLYYFFYIALFVLAVGGFYGVLNKTVSYKKLLDKIVTGVKPLGKKFIFALILIIAFISSLTGLTLPLIIFVPFIVSIILLLGYDKLVALTTTIGSIMIGYIGGVFVTFMNPNTYAIGTYEKFVGAEGQFTNMFPKLLLLFAGITLLIYFVNKYIIAVEKKKVKYELTDNSELLISEIKGSYKGIKTWPLIVIFSFLFVLLVLGMMPWKSLFEFDAFNNFHTWLNGLKIGNFAIIPSIFSTDFFALGEWGSNGDLMAYLTIVTMLFIITIVTAIVNKVKVNDTIDGYVEGAKKLLPAAGLMMLAYTVLVCAYTNGFYETIVSSYGKFNYGVSSLLTFLGCLLNIDTYYVAVGTFSPILKLITDESVYSSVAILFQGIYGIFSLVGPTSLILIFGLTYLDVPYTTWIKYIWRFILGLIILLALVTALVVLL